MDIAWSLFTPWHSLAGGALIGLAASLLLLGNGQIAGISGILGNLLTREGRAPWRLAFLAGMVLSPLLLWPVMVEVAPATVQTPDIDTQTASALASPTAALADMACVAWPAFPFARWLRSSPSWARAL